MTSSNERRKSIRFQIVDGAFAFINNTPFSIRNISKGGVQLESAVYDESPLDEMQLDIFLKNENFYLQGLPVRLVRFQKTSSSSPFSNVHVKCFGLQFGKLTQQQKTRLDQFISQNAIS